MKKVLLAIAAVATITSCSQNEEFENPVQKAEIGFNSVVRKATRAADTTGDNFLAFTVNSYVTEGEYSGVTALGDAYMDEISYTRTDNTAPWSASGENLKTYYWPSINSGKKVQFFAFPTASPTPYSLPATGYPSISFTVNNTIANQKDLIVAYAANVTSESEGVNNGTLTLDFKHVLTRINFAYIPDNDGLTYDITEISIADVQGGKGKYTFDASNGSWDLNEATASSYTYDVEKSTTLVSGKNYYSLAKENGSWMLFPQKVGKKVISIKYSTKQGEMEVYSGTKTVTLPDNAEWGLGQNVLYVLTLPAGGTQAQLDTKVSGWNAVTEDEKTAK